MTGVQTCALPIYAQKQKSAGKIDGAVRQRINAEPQALHKTAPFPVFNLDGKEGGLFRKAGYSFFFSIVRKASAQADAKTGAPGDGRAG